VGSTVARQLSGRRAEAARNDARILDAAREVFTSDPGAPIAAVAERAGVGIGALYRRHHSKDGLLQRLATDGLRRYVAAAEAALVEGAEDAEGGGGGDPWAAFVRFMGQALDDGAGSLTVRLAGAFTPTEELYLLGRRAYELTRRLLDRTKSAGALRRDAEVSDIALIFEQLQAVRAGDGERAAQLRHRYLALYLDALHATTGRPLPGPPPSWEELSERYEA
jgi:AcrR family transcriptional regulator